MKKQWSRNWNRSEQPRKQRKYVINAPLHILRKLLSVRLNKDLRKKYQKRNIPVRKGDTVKVMVGHFKNRLAKVEEVDTKRTKVYVEGVVRTRKDGSKIPLSTHPSNLMIMELNLNDKLRKEALERK